jgi:hypothetical protein
MSYNPLPQPASIGFGTFGSTGIVTVTNVHPLPTYLENIEVSSKGRLKVTTPETIFFNTFQYGIETDVWDTRVSVGGTAVWDYIISGVGMSVTSSAGSEVIRQTKNVMRYIPGRPAEIAFAVRLEQPKSGVRRRFGLFDGQDGFYFEDDGGDYACVMINSNGPSGIITERYSRSQWNGDKLDGNGPSGIVASPSAQQMIVMEYEWYGAGQIKFHYEINGKVHTIHTINTGNRLPYPWSKTPFLPIRLEIKNTTGVSTGPHYLYQGSNSLVSEGFTEKLGIAQNVGTAVTGRILPVAQTYYPLISIRLKSTALTGIVLPTFFQAASLYQASPSQNATVISLGYKLIRNANLTGGAWVDMPDENAFTQYNRTATGIGTAGIDLDSGFIIGGNSGSGIRLDKDTVYQIGRSGIGTISDTLTLAVAVLDSGVTNAVAYGAMTWIEQR